MNAKNLNGEFKDPLFSRVDDRPQVKRQAVSGSKSRSGRSMKWLVASVLGILSLGALMFFLADSRQQIAQLQTEIRSSQDQWSSVSQELQVSQSEIGELHQGISVGQTQISEQKQQIRQYQNLYADLKSQQQQTRNLEAVHRNKAERSAMETLRTQTGEISERVQQANANIADLRDSSNQNHTDIESQEESIGQLQSQVTTTEERLAALKDTVERAYYHFEISEKSGFMKTLDVSLRLRDADFRKQRYDLDIFSGRKRIQKKDQPINEPIYFYVDGFQHPYEILVNKVEKSFVVGYLSVPKSRTR